MPDGSRTHAGGESPRKFESIVDAIVARYSNSERKRLKVFMTCGIGPEHFHHHCDDEKYGLQNMRMVMEVESKWGNSCLSGDWVQGKLSLSEIVRSQFIKHGVRPFNIGWDVVDTYEDRNKDEELRWWSYRRGDGKKRNGVLVVRNW